MDLKSISRWFDCSRGSDDMFRVTDTSWAPWFVAHANDKRRGRWQTVICGPVDAARSGEVGFPQPGAVPVGAATVGADQ